MKTVDIFEQHKTTRALQAYQSRCFGGFETFLGSMCKSHRGWPLWAGSVEVRRLRVAPLRVQRRAQLQGGGRTSRGGGADSNKNQPPPLLGGGRLFQRRGMGLGGEEFAETTPLKRVGGGGLPPPSLTTTDKAVGQGVIWIQNIVDVSKEKSEKTLLIRGKLQTKSFFC